MSSELKILPKEEVDKMSADELEEYRNALWSYNYKLGILLRDKSYEEYFPDIKGKYIRYYGPFGDSLIFMFVENVSVRRANDHEDDEVTLSGLVFRGNVTQYRDMTYFYYDEMSTSKESISIKIGSYVDHCDRRKTDSEAKNYLIEIITEEEFKSEFYKLHRKIKKSFNECLDYFNSEDYQKTLKDEN